MTESEPLACAAPCATGAQPVAGTSPSAGDDLALRLPIAGVQLIEASAGTGKTFTLATLYARLVIELALPVASVLAVTFTEAATKELRERLRARLVLAQRLVEAGVSSDEDPGLAAVGDSEEVRLTRALIARALQREAVGALRARLRRASEQMDLAPIHTIHGFCARALAEHALEAGQPLLEPTLVENESGLRQEIALEFWRRQSLEAQGAQTLGSIWGSPAALALSLRDLADADVLLPPPVPESDTQAGALQPAREELARQFRLHGENARAQLRRALALGHIDKRVVNDGVVDALWQAMDDWLAGSLHRDPASDKLAQYGRGRLRAKLNAKGKDELPDSPLFAAIEQWSLACEQAELAARGRRVAMVHAARDYAGRRSTQLKHERHLLGYQDMIAGVADALAGAGGERFAERLQAQYRVALLDEFQDTDARQWAIFSRLFAQAPQDGQPRALFLIGDPKQAIYRFRGGDVFTYLAAEKSADAKHHLQHNFRSRPSVLAATAALFELSGADAFAQEGIAFEAVHAGGACRDHDLQLDGSDVPALNLLLLPPVEGKEAIEDARTRATAACVAQIHALLGAGLAGRLTLVDRRGVARTLAPGDIAVLVEKNADAERVHDALAAAGIPSVAAGRSSVYSSDEAQHLGWLLHALLAPADDARLRAALASPLLGLDAAALASFENDEARHRLWQDRLQHWQVRAQGLGLMALVTELCAESAPRLLAWPDGERRLTNYLQLAEALQDAGPAALGLAGALRELERRVAEADEGSEAELLRLESDAARVKILTLHKAKGLEFEIVLLPFAGSNGAERPASTPKMARFHDGERRVVQLYPDKDDAAAQAERGEERAEKLRLLYVGLTRARLATWVVWGVMAQLHKTALAWLLHRPPGAPDVAEIREADLDRDCARLRERAPQAIAVQPATMPAGALPRLAWAAAQALPEAAVARRALDRDWWVYSFSQLSREDSGSEAAAADDEIELWPAATHSRFAGPRFGNSLHQALEHVDFSRWLDWSGALPPAGEAAVLSQALHQHGYSTEDDQREGLPLLTALVSETLNTRLPEGTRLAALERHARCDEMEFHLALAPTRLAEMIDLLHRHDVIKDRRSFGVRGRIEGLLTGRIDLVYEAQGRFYIVDYKSNRLRDYAPASLASAVRDSEYDLQYVLYCLALHRWLRFKLGADYDFQRHLGGVRYLFCRGLDREQAASPGIHAPPVPRALIEALDALLGGAP